MAGADSALQTALDWCRQALGPCDLLADNSREHPGERASLARLRSPLGNCYLKLHRSAEHWNSETHAYEHWTRAFGDKAPRLLAVREEAPLALVISDLPGRPLEETSLPQEAEIVLWREAGRALTGLHHREVGDFFGPCRRDGSPAVESPRGAVEYLSAQFDDWQRRGERLGCLREEELAVVEKARGGLGLFAGLPPVPCHRDYCPANWLTAESGAWTGVIDFEFSGWDVWAADLTRDALWNWRLRPQVYAAMLQGYAEGRGRGFSAEEEQQLWVCHALYALGAVVWGVENEYFIYAAEGREALTALGKSLISR